MKPNVRRLAHIACDHAHSFTHSQGLPYQILEGEDSGLPQQGILPISAKKTITMANHRWLEKDFSHCAVAQVSLQACFFVHFGKNSMHWPLANTQCHAKANGMSLLMGLQRVHKKQAWMVGW